MSAPQKSALWGFGEFIKKWPQWTVVILLLAVFGFFFAKEVTSWTAAFAIPLLFVCVAAVLLIGFAMQRLVDQRRMENPATPEVTLQGGDDDPDRATISRVNWPRDLRHPTLAPMYECLSSLHVGALAAFSVKDSRGHWTKIMEHISRINEAAHDASLLHLFEVLGDTELAKVIKHLLRGDGCVSLESSGELLLAAIQRRRSRDGNMAKALADSLDILEKRIREKFPRVPLDENFFSEITYPQEQLPPPANSG